MGENQGRKENSMEKPSTQTRVRVEKSVVDRLKAFWMGPHDSLNKVITRILDKLEEYEKAKRK